MSAIIYNFWSLLTGHYTPPDRVSRTEQTQEHCTFAQCFGKQKYLLCSKCAFWAGHMLKVTVSCVPMARLPPATTTLHFPRAATPHTARQIWHNSALIPYCLKTKYHANLFHLNVPLIGFADFFALLCCHRLCSYQWHSPVPLVPFTMYPG